MENNTQKFNFLVIGSGGREYSLCTKLQKSIFVHKLFTIPGSTSWQNVALCDSSIDISNFNNVGLFCNENNVKYVIVGPEKPLCDGIVDYLQHFHPDIFVFGPNKNCAVLESDKGIAKKIMQLAGINCAQSVIAINYNDAINKFNHFKYPLVLKSCNLAMGKGVKIVNTYEAAKNYAAKIFINEYFGKNNKLLIEEFLKGQELSSFWVVKNNCAKFISNIIDHKRVSKNENSKMTGGMGVHNLFSSSLFNSSQIKETCVDPLMRYFSKNKMSYNGILFLGLMKVDYSYYVLEYNVRFGDPETELLMFLWDSDLGEFLINFFTNNKFKITLNQQKCLGIVLCAQGYPQNYIKNINMNWLRELPFIVIPMGMKQQNNNLFSTGGRICIVFYKFDCEFDISSQLKKFHKLLKFYVNKNSLNSIIYRDDIGLKN